MRDKKLEFCFHSKFGRISYSFLKIVSFINFQNTSIFVHLSVVYKEALEKSSFFFLHCHMALSRETHLSSKMASTLLSKGN